MDAKNSTSTGTTTQLVSSDYATEERRSWLAKEYLSGGIPALLWREYSKTYGLTKHSFDRDLVIVRKQIGTSVRENYDLIVDDMYNNLQQMILQAIDDKDTQL